jgi:hypothetical protein
MVTRRKAAKKTVKRAAKRRKTAKRKTAKKGVKKAAKRRKAARKNEGFSFWA